MKKGLESSQREKTVLSNTLVIGGEAGITVSGNNPEKFISAPPNMGILTSTSRKRQREKTKENIKGFYLPGLQGVPWADKRESLMGQLSRIAHTV